MLKNLIILHCSATPNGRALGHTARGTPSFVNAAQVIDDWHAERGFARSREARARYNPDLRAIGYQFVIDVNGSVISGRAIDETGAHAAGYNASSIGICLVGTDAFTEAQWTALRLCLRDDAGGGLARLTDIPIASPKRGVSGLLFGGVCGHRDVSPDLDGDGRIEPREWTKTCPGFDVAGYLARGLDPDPAHVCEPQRTAP